MYFAILMGCLTPWLLKTSSPLARWSLSFNNPNQLGYYSILILSLSVFTFNEIIRNKPKMKPAYMAGFCIIVEL
jgi:hypothetical protein